MKILILLTFFSFNILAKDIFIDNYQNLKVKQFGKEWCWAATLEAVYKFKNQQVSQLEIIQGYTNKTKEEIIQNKDSIFLGIPSNLFINHYLRNFNQIKQSEIINSLKQNKPIIMINKNHVSLIIGYYNNHYVSMDPAEGRFILLKANQIKYLYKNPKFKNKSLFFEVTS